MTYFLQKLFLCAGIYVASVFREVIGLPLTRVDSDAEGVSSSESSLTGSLSFLSSLPASSEATVSTGATGLEDGGWR